MNSTKLNSDIFKKVVPKSQVALIYHLQIKDNEAFSNWRINSTELLNRSGGKRLYNISVDPVPREGMLINELIIDEYPSPEAALEFVAATQTELSETCQNVTILAIEPEPNIKFRIVHVIAFLMHLFNGINDSGTPTANWKANNTAIWPDEKQMAVARAQDLDRPLLVYNLNKNKKIALYQNASQDAKPCSGEEAYERYSKIAGAQLLRRGAYPVYGGKPIGILVGENNMLSDDWSKFILVYYPQRRNLLAMIEGEKFKSGQYHRDAGLERVAIFMGNGKASCATT